MKNVKVEEEEEEEGSYRRMVRELLLARLGTIQYKILHIVSTGLRRGGGGCFLLGSGKKKKRKKKR